MKTTRAALRDAARSGEPIELVVRRDDRNLLVSLSPEPVCDYRAILAAQENVNAYADGENVYVTRGMMRFAETDDELALVIAHEIAHNAMNHIDAQRSCPTQLTPLATAEQSARASLARLAENLALGREHSLDETAAADRKAVGEIAHPAAQ